MSTNLRTYSFTLDPSLIDSLKVKLAGNSLSQYLNRLIELDFMRNNQEVKPKGNLSKWLAKYKSTSIEPITVRTNKEIMDIYANKLGR